MDELTQLWVKVEEHLRTEFFNKSDEEYLFDDIMRIKAAYEYSKMAVLGIDDYMTPTQYTYALCMMKRAFLEGYFTAKEQLTGYLENCYKKKGRKRNEKKNMDVHCTDNSTATDNRS